jgi:hypothetical protein
VEAPNILLTNGTDDPTANGEITYVTGTGFRAFANGSAFTVGSGGGGGAVGGLDSVYSVADNAVTLDEGAIDWTDATTGALNSMSFTQTGAKSGNILDFSVDAALTGRAIAIDMNLGIAAQAIFIDNGGTARTGSDILITDDSTGNHSCIDINSSGNSASVGFDWTGSFTGSPGGSAVSVTFDNADNLDTNGLLITTGTGVRTGPCINIDSGDTGSADLIDIDVGGVLTGDVIDIAYSAAATGNAIFLNMDTAVAATALHMEGSGIRTQPFIELITDSTSSASLIDISVNGAITGTAAIDIDMNAGLAANALFIDAGAGTRTANLIDITHDGNGNVDALQITHSNTGSGSVLDINVTSTGSGNVVDIAMSGAHTGDVISIDMDGALGSSALVLDYGAGTRTDDMCKVTFDGDGTSPFWDINVSNTGAGGTTDYWDIDVSGVFTGSVLDVTYGAAATGDCISLNMTSAVAAKAMIFTGAGARTDDLIEINDSSTSNASCFDINLTGAFTTNYAFDLNASGVHTSGLMNLTSNSSNVGARNLLNVVNDNAAAVGTIPIAIQQDAVTNTNFKTIMVLDDFTVFVSDGTTAEGALTGVEGDICLNGGTGAGQMAFCDANGTNWTDM